MIINPIKITIIHLKTLFDHLRIRRIIFDATFSRLLLEIQIEECKFFYLYKCIGNLREILKIDECNLGLP